ncbi:putative Uncharacterized 50.6 kDa protein in the 5'region of gyrA and gyrB [Plantibacter sp. T3]|nr:putative Uncharacterized 50.6 kDa protein in the 5'region of gyrA and gyrB [Plantibacter sp. T3]
MAGADRLRHLAGRRTRGAVDGRPRAAGRRRLDRRLGYPDGGSLHPLVTARDVRGRAASRRPIRRLLPGRDGLHAARRTHAVRDPRAVERCGRPHQPDRARDRHPARARRRTGVPRRDAAEGPREGPRQPFRERRRLRAGAAACRDGAGLRADAHRHPEPRTAAVAGPPTGHVQQCVGRDAGPAGPDGRGPAPTRRAECAAVHRRRDGRALGRTARPTDPAVGADHRRSGLGALRDDTPRPPRDRGCSSHGGSRCRRRRTGQTSPTDPPPRRGRRRGARGRRYRGRDHLAGRRRRPEADGRGDRGAHPTERRPLAEAVRGEHQRGRQRRDVHLGQPGSAGRRLVHLPGDEQRQELAEGTDLDVRGRPEAERSGCAAVHRGGDRPRRRHLTGSTRDVLAAVAGARR